MPNTSLKKVAFAWDRVKDQAKKNMSTITGATIGGLIGGYGTHRYMNNPKRVKERQELFKSNPALYRFYYGNLPPEHTGTQVALNAFNGAVLGGSLGLMHDDRRFWKNYGRGQYGGHSRSYRRPPPPPPRSNDFDHHFNVAKTKKEAKTIYRDLMSKHHPDKGGSTQTAQKLNEAWDHFKKHRFEKLSYILSSIFR